jgi:hypothetical protein
MPYDDETNRHTTDGLGQPLIAGASYYVQDTRAQVGNCTLFWGKDSAGYVCDLDAAGTYLGCDVEIMRETDIAWPVDHILNHSVRHVRVEGLARTRHHDVEKKQHAAMRKWMER